MLRSGAESDVNGRGAGKASMKRDRTRETEDGIKGSNSMGWVEMEGRAVGKWQRFVFHSSVCQRGHFCGKGRTASASPPCRRHHSCTLVAPFPHTKTTVNQFGGKCKNLDQRATASLLASLPDAHIVFPRRGKCEAPATKKQKNTSLAISD